MKERSCCLVFLPISRFQTRNTFNFSFSWKSTLYVEEISFSLSVSQRNEYVLQRFLFWSQSPKLSYIPFNLNFAREKFKRSPLLFHRDCVCFDLGYANGCSSTEKQRGSRSSGGTTEAAPGVSLLVGLWPRGFRERRTGTKFAPWLRAEDTSSVNAISLHEIETTNTSFTMINMSRRWQIYLITTLLVTRHWPIFLTSVATFHDFKDEFSQRWLNRKVCRKKITNKDCKWSVFFFKFNYVIAFKKVERAVNN